MFNIRGLPLLHVPNGPGTEYRTQQETNSSDVDLKRDSQRGGSGSISTVLRVPSVKSGHWYTSPLVEVVQHTRPSTEHIPHIVRCTLLRPADHSWYTPKCVPKVHDPPCIPCPNMPSRGSTVPVQPVQSVRSYSSPREK